MNTSAASIDHVGSDPLTYRVDSAAAVHHTPDMIQACKDCRSPTETARRIVHQRRHQLYMVVTDVEAPVPYPTLLCLPFRSEVLPIAHISFPVSQFPTITALICLVRLLPNPTL